jgi:stage II sporulation protein D
MRRDPLTRAALAALAAIVALGACSSDDGSSTPTPLTPPTPPTPAASSTGAAGSSAATTPRPSADPPAAGLDLSQGRITVRAPRGGSIRVRGSYPSSPSRCVDRDPLVFDGRYPGALTLRATDDGTITASVTVSFRQYLEGIAEVPPTWPRAALEAQVIAARSYVLSRTGWTGEPGETLEPICGTSACQVYGGIPQPRPPGLGRWNRAVVDTRGQVPLSGGEPADTLYFSTSNGRTYGNDEVFGGTPLPYLRPVVERDDGTSPLSRWRVEMPLHDVAVMLRAAGSWPRGSPITAASVRGSAITLSGGGETRAIDDGALRDAANAWGPCLLPRRYPTDGLPTTIPSGWFGVTSARNGLVTTGRGWGHGVGMVQWGAYGKARAGWPAARILAFYYGGLTPTRFPEPETVQVVIATGLRSAILTPSGPGARIGGQTLGPGAIRVAGGEDLTITGGG